MPKDCHTYYVPDLHLVYFHAFSIWKQYKPFNPCKTFGCFPWPSKFEMTICVNRLLPFHLVMNDNRYLAKPCTLINCTTWKLLQTYAWIAEIQYAYMCSHSPGRIDPLNAPIGGNVNKYLSLFLSLLFRKGVPFGLI
jgi:hypothetical protein